MKLSPRVKVCIHILIGLSLFVVFSMGARQILQTMKSARYFSIGALRPQPMDYLWRISVDHARVDDNLVRYYADYYENLLQVFPSMGDAYGVLGYCYHYLGDDHRSENFLQKAVRNDPDYFWFYYDLALLQLHEHHYEAAKTQLANALQVSPEANLKALSKSAVFGELLPSSGSSFKEYIPHMQQAYVQTLLLLKVLDSSLPSYRTEAILKQLQLQLYLF